MKYYWTLLFLILPTLIFAQTNLARLSTEELDNYRIRAKKQSDYNTVLQIDEVLISKVEVKDDSVYAVYLANYANDLIKVGQLKKAEAPLKESIKVIAKVFGSDHYKYFAMQNTLGNYYLRTSQLDQAEIHYYQIYREAQKHLEPANNNFLFILQNLGAVYYYKGRFETAAEVFKKVLEVRAKTRKKNAQYAAMLNNIGECYRQSNELEKAVSFYKEAIDLYKQLELTQTGPYALVINNLAIVHATQKDLVKAEKLFLNSMNIRKDILGKKHPDFIQAKMNLGSLYRESGKFDKAEKELLESLSISQEVLGQNNSEVAQIYLYLALLKSEQKAPSAIEYFKKSNATYLAFLGNENHQYADNLRAFAAHYLNIDEIDDAETLLIQALNAISPDFDSTIVLNDLLKSDNFQNYNENVFIKILNTISVFYEKKYEKTNDLNVLHNSYKIVKLAYQRSNSFRQSLSTERDQLNILSENNKIVSSLLNLANTLREKTQEEKYINEAFQFAETSKSVLLADALKAQQNRSVGNLPDSLIDQEQAMKQKLAQLQKQLLTSTDSIKQVARVSINALNQDIEDFKEKIKNQYPKYYQNTFSSQTLDIQAIQKELEEDMALLEYHIADSSVYVFYIDKQSSQLQMIANAQSQFVKKVKDLRKSLSDYHFIKEKPQKAFELYHTNAVWFYDQFLYPVLKDKDQIKHLNIITDGQLGHLPFEAFLTEKITASKPEYKELPYLIKRYKISYNYSAGLWTENKKLGQNKQQNNGKILALAASYNKASIDSLQNRGITRSFRMISLRKALNDLPQARAEVQALESKFEGSFLLAEAATEAAFKQQAKDYNILHLAMHGILDQKHPILSSMAFTENGDTTEDNFLQAWEISNMELNANLVVLSACETGFGKFQQGEGVMSLARSFMYAGVPSLVVSLWQVSDASTAVIMENFYQNLNQGMDKAKALQQAKLYYLDQVEGIAAHPAYWAAFIQLGDEEAIALPASGWGNIWIWLGIGLVVVMLLVIALKGRRK